MKHYRTKNTFLDKPISTSSPVHQHKELFIQKHTKKSAVSQLIFQLSLTCHFILKPHTVRHDDTSAKDIYLRHVYKATVVHRPTEIATHGPVLLTTENLKLVTLTYKSLIIVN